MTAIVELVPGPEAFMIRLCMIDEKQISVSIGEAEVQLIRARLNDVSGRTNCRCDGPGSKTRRKMAVDVILEIAGLQEFGLEVIVSSLHN